jgi:hypothetical protein
MSQRSSDDDDSAQAVWGQQGPAMVDAVALRAVHISDSLRGQEVSNILWACAVLRCRCVCVLDTCCRLLILYRLRPLYIKLAARAEAMKSELHPQAIGNIAWVCGAFLTLNTLRLMLLQALSKMSSVTGNDSAPIASLCAEASARLHVFDTQSLAQLFCACVKHAHLSQFALFVVCACKQLITRVASLDGISAGCLAGALATASQNVSEGDLCYADVRACVIALCSRWLLSPALALGPQHTAFMCRCLVSSLDEVQVVVGEQLNMRGIRRRVVDSVAKMVKDMNWFCVAHVELLLILMSNAGRSNSTETPWLRVPKKQKSILKATRQRMCDATTSMLSSYESFDREAIKALLNSTLDLPGQATVLMCGGGGPGKLRWLLSLGADATDLMSCR